MKLQKIQNCILVGLFFIFVFVLPLITLNFSKLSSNSEKNNTIHRIDITLNNTSIDSIDNGVKGESYSGGVMQLSSGELFLDIEIKGRGNSSWTTEKKSYQIKLSKKANLFGAGTSKRWILISNILDDSLIRNDVAFYINKMLDVPYTRKGFFSELYVDGEYRGLYYVIKKISIGKDDINLKDPYGIVAELDTLWSKNDPRCYYTNGKGCLLLKDSVSRDNEDFAMKNLTDDCSKLEVAVRKKNFDEIKDLIDIESAAKYFLLSEFTMNPDAYTSSLYIYKDGMQDKIHFGVGWDFDFSLGNRNWVYTDQGDFYSPYNDMPLKNEALCGDSAVSFDIHATNCNGIVKTMSQVFYGLMDMPEFRAEVKRVYQNTLSKKASELLNYINLLGELIRDEAHRDGDRWGKDKFDSELLYLVDWVQKRFDYFEQTYGD